MRLCRPKCDGHRGPDLPETWRPWGPGRKPPAAAQSGPHQPVCPVGPGGPGPQAGTGQPPPSIQAPRRGGVRVFKHELSLPTPEQNVRMTPPQTLPVLCPPSSLYTRRPWVQAGSPVTVAGRTGRQMGTPSLACVPPPGSPSCVPRAWARLPGGPAPRAATGLGEPAPQTLTPRRASPSSSWLHPQGEGRRRCCGRSEREGRTRGEKRLLPRTAVRARKPLTPFPPALSSAATLAETGRVQRKAGGGRGPTWAGPARACW